MVKGPPLFPQLDRDTATVPVEVVLADEARSRLAEVEAERDEWCKLILKADAASDTERALATLANMVRQTLDDSRE